MNLHQDFQKLLFDRIRELMQPNQSFAGIISNLLSIDESTVYKKSRGDLNISFQEGVLLATHFGISLEELTNSNKSTIPFHKVRMSGSEEHVKNFLEVTTGHFLKFSKLKDFKGIYSSKDIPIFYYFEYPILAKFKMFFWLKTMKEHADLSDKEFDPDLISPEMYEACASVSKIYTHLPFIEIWNKETVTGMLNQIEYYRESGFISSKEHGLAICKDFEQLIRNIEIQCAKKRKCVKGVPIEPEVPYRLYFDELTNFEEKITVSGDEDFRFELQTYNAMDYICTYHKGFATEVMEEQENQINKSLSFYGAGGKERNKFFNSVYEKIKFQEAEFLKMKR